MNERIGRFQLLKKIASGGMAEIYIARQYGVEGFEKLVVIKKLLPELTKNSQFMQMFVNEAKLAARLNHPNIVQIYDLGFTEGSYFIAMEFIQGEDLVSLVKTCRKRGAALPMHYSIRIVSQVCEGLHFAHTKADVLGNPLKIVHCDISPHNIVISFEGAVKVIDFGVAKAATFIEDEDSKNQIRGKLAYMSPEQCTGGTMDARSDLFSLGVVLWELITGRRLYGKLGTKEIFRAASNANISPPRSVNPAVPEQLDSIVMRAVARQPQDRFGSAYEMCQELESFVKTSGWGATSFDLAAFVRELFHDKLEAMRRYLAAQATGADLESFLFADVRETSKIGQADENSEHSSFPLAAPGPRHDTAGEKPRRALPRRLFLLSLLLLLAVAGYFFYPQIITNVKNLLKRKDAAREAAPTGVVKVISTPAGATVWLDGEDRCAAPCTLNQVVLASEHQLEVSMDGHEPFNFRFKLTEPEEERAFKVLLNKQGKVDWARARIVTTPPGARVELNGLLLKGKTPLFIPRLTPERTYKLRAFLAGHQDWITTFKFGPSEVKTISGTL